MSINKLLAFTSRLILPNDGTEPVVNLLNISIIVANQRQMIQQTHYNRIESNLVKDEARKQLMSIDRMTGVSDCYSTNKLPPTVYCPELEMIVNKMIMTTANEQLETHLRKQLCHWLVAGNFH